MCKERNRDSAARDRETDAETDGRRQEVRGGCRLGSTGIRVPSFGKRRKGGGELTGFRGERGVQVAVGARHGPGGSQLGGQKSVPVTAEDGTMSCSSLEQRPRGAGVAAVQGWAENVVPELRRSALLEVQRATRF